MSLRRSCCGGSELPERARRRPDCVSSGIKERLPLARPSSDRMMLRRSPHFRCVCGWGIQLWFDVELATVDPRPGEATKQASSPRPAMTTSGAGALPGQSSPSLFHFSRHARACPGHPRPFQAPTGRTWMAGTRPGHDNVGSRGTPRSNQAHNSPPSSCPGLSRASTCFLSPCKRRTWMAGTSATKQSFVASLGHDG